MARTTAQRPEGSGEQRNGQSKEERFERPNEVSLSAPWGGGMSNFAVFGKQRASAVNEEIPVVFIQERTRIHELYIRQQGRIKMLGFGLSALMFMVSGIVAVFSPPEKSILAYAFARCVVPSSSGWMWNT
jgi:hypothetical protein